MAFLPTPHTPFEVFEDITEQVTETNLVYTVGKPPYVAGTVSLWRNGLLQDAEYFTETDPATGKVTIADDFDLRPESDHALHVSYQTTQNIFVKPDDPVHISQIKPGDVLRIAMKPGRHLEPVLWPKTKQNVLMPGRTPHGRSLRAKGFSRTVFLGLVTTNSPTDGLLTLQVDGRNNQRAMSAHVPYKDIQHVQKYITPTKVLGADVVPIGGGPRAIRRPGAIAKGVMDAKGFMNLVRVFF